MSVPDTCPECGGEVQATVEVYLTRRNGQWVFPYDDGVVWAPEASFYCENDHKLDGLADREDVAALNKVIAVPRA